MSAAAEARPPRESATVLLLRDGPEGLEVYMVRRHLNSDFVGGAYVFPGGGLDPADLAPDVLARVAGVDPAEAGRRLGLPPERALAHWVAAVRETFEEAGILLAEADGAPVAMAAAPDMARWEARRKALLDGSLGWPALLGEEGLTLTGGNVGYFAHWVTPEGSPRRFSTRFFAAEVPNAQEAMADDMEVEAGTWIRPKDALHAHARGEWTIIFPTVKTLEELATFATAADVVAACRDRAVVTKLPRIVLRDGKPAVLLPGDAGYEEAAGQAPPAFDPSRL